ncbi:TonB-dependent receptor [Pseudoluteimonas lycopersici]|uniref:TonB-dependent receptor n=1 Tax=Pseudoluteimonas lycopersici TaxID=1324796 RepID=A0A516V851_9GAMM|nr:TonB-dependent receptor [Lysobacter lycopersici]QDQ74680.1 TonB-dependent receptor [Lysobacter lycopersici]
MNRPTRTALFIALGCISTSFAWAQEAEAAPRRIDIPAGDLVSGLDALAAQSGTQLLYRADQLKGARTRGVHGTVSPDDALKQLLSGSGYGVHRDSSSGAVVIVKADQQEPPAPAATKPAAAPAPAPAQAEPPPEPAKLESIEVTGSRIPRAEVEGPAPVTVITAQQISSAGFTSVPDVLRSLTQNGGETQSPQSSLGAATTPGAQQVDLRGLGSNKTLVLINGRRIADFPLPLGGRSNFTDIGNIPLGMVDRIEVLTGSASAVYGSDAMAGVINFILKKSADGTTLDYRYGDTARGGGESNKFTLTTGFERGNFSGIVGLELLDKKPLWAYDRKIQDSSFDSPDPDEEAPWIFQRFDWFGGTSFPEDEDKCDPSLNGGSTFPESGDYGFYCGSDKSIGYGTIESGRKSVNAYGSFNFDINDKLSWFADVQLGYAKVELMYQPLTWQYQGQTEDGDRGVFYNANSETWEYWYRQFTPEESGGFHDVMTHDTQKTLSIATGFKGTIGEDWDYEALFNHSQYHATVSYPRIVASKANELLLGPQQGVDDYGYAIFSPDSDQFYKPLTQAQYDSITADSVFKPTARSDTLSFTIDNTSLFHLPAGDVGFAGNVEYGTQAYDIHPDPLALTDYYYGARYGDGHGDRSHWGIASEFRVPVFQPLTLSMAGRYDQYSYGDKSPGKFTYSLGLEWRPIDALLLRGSYGTGFRAPDLHYLFAQTDYFRSRQRDYYTCRQEDDYTSDADCSRKRVRNQRTGDPNLDYETSKSFTAGFVWSPPLSSSANFDLSVDYFNIKVSNQIEEMDPDKIMLAEANCRDGFIDPNSPICLDAVPRALRDENGDLLGVYYQPINIAEQRVAGYDLAANFRWDSAIGAWRFGLTHTLFTRHDSRESEDDPLNDHFAVNSGYDVPKTKTTASIGWERNAWSATLHAQRIGRLPSSDSYDQVWDPDTSAGGAWIGATMLYNGSLQYRINDRMQLSLAVDNLFDKMPPKDKTYTSYPYYDISWFDSVGRSYFLEFTWKLGGSPL